jgi:hypothetical protein
METQKQSFSRSQTSSNFIFETCSVVPTFFFSVDSPIHFRFLLLQVWITTTNPRPDFSVSHGVRHVKSLKKQCFGNFHILSIVNSPYPTFRFESPRSLGTRDRDLGDGVPQNRRDTSGQSHPQPSNAAPVMGTL